MRSASPQAQIQAPRFAMLADNTEISFQPGGGYVATSRIEHESGEIELVIECFDRNGVSGGRQTALIQGCCLSAQF